MCGDFGWDDKSWSHEKDETKKFIIDTGFMYSDKWVQYCKKELHCKQDKKYRTWQTELNTTRHQNDPPIPKDIVGPFTRCKAKIKHEKGKPELDFNPKHPGKRDNDLSELIDEV